MDQAFGSGKDQGFLKVNPDRRWTKLAQRSPFYPVVVVVVVILQSFVAVLGHGIECSRSSYDRMCMPEI